MMAPPIPASRNQIQGWLANEPRPRSESRQAGDGLVRRRIRRDASGGAMILGRSDMTRPLALSILTVCLVSCGILEVAAAAAPFPAPATRDDAALGGCQAVFTDPSDGVGVVQPGPFAFVKGSSVPGVTE